MFRNEWALCSANHFFGEFFAEETKALMAKSEKIRAFYLGDKEISLEGEAFQNLTNAFTDPGFFYGSDLTARYILAMEVKSLVANGLFYTTLQQVAPNCSF